MMSYIWEHEFRDRLVIFREAIPETNEGLTISIKVKVTGGCFHREHSPNAYRIIDDYLNSIQGEKYFSFEEHESGPEVLVYAVYTAYATLGTAVISLSKSVIDLIATIIKARAEGIKEGDGPNQPLELIVRGFDENGTLREEKILRINHFDAVESHLLRQLLEDAASKFLPKDKKK